MKERSEIRIPELDGVRAIAIWMVLLTHVMVGYRNPPGAWDFLPGMVQQAIGHGWLGVDLFFMLSGFLITGILLDSRERPHYFRNFYVRRFLRIMPLYFTVVLIWSLFYHGYRHYLLLSSVFGANLAPLVHVPTPHGPGVLWSLAVEEHFYLLWPAVVLLVPRRKLLWLCLAIFVGCPVLRGVYAHRGMDPEVIYGLSWFRFDGLAAGAAIAIWAKSSRFERRTAYRIALSALLALCVISFAGAKFGLFGTKTPLAVALRYTQAYFVFTALLVLSLVYRGTRWTAVLRNPFMQLSGALSYCLYLIHLSLGDGYQVLFAKTVRLGPTATVLVRGAFIVVVSFALAALSRKFLEEPFLALKAKFTLQPKTSPRKTDVDLSPALESQT